jgi:hypothetical protein
MSPSLSHRLGNLALTLAVSSSDDDQREALCEGTLVRGGITIIALAFLVKLFDQSLYVILAPGALKVGLEGALF